MQEEKEVVISVKNVSKTFKVYFDKGTSLKEKAIFWKRNKHEIRHILNDVSFDIHKGETVGLIGRNGCGKSTMLKMLTGIYWPNGGELDIKGRVSSLIELGAGFHPDMSGRDNIYTNASIFGLSKKEIDERLDDIITFSELEEFIDNPVRTYSSGMYMRLAFSVAINVDADVLLIDEILAVGDANFQAKCFAKLRDLKAKGITIVIVTHDSSVIQSFCDRAIWIEDGIIQFDGNSTTAIDKYLEYMSNEKRIRMLDEEDKAHLKAMKEKSINTKLIIEGEKLKDETGDTRITLNQANNRFGLFNAEITRAYMLNDEGKESWIHTTNKPCQIVIEYKINRESKYGFVFGMGFSTRDGHLIYGTNTQLDGLKINCDIGESGTIKFKINSLPLLNGEYSVNVSIVDENGTPLDFYREYNVLRVVSNIKSPGTTLISHEWER